MSPRSSDSLTEPIGYNPTSDHTPSDTHTEAKPAQSSRQLYGAALAVSKPTPSVSRDSTAHPWSYRLATAAGIVTVMALFAWGAWQRRWIADDGLIVLRTIRNLLAGYGPVFNQGERVEVNTSAAWTFLLAAIAWVSHARLEYVALATALILSVAAVGLAAWTSARFYRTKGALVTVPLGALVYVAVPAARDFATSGLEVGLCIFWLSLLWWFNHKLVDNPTSLFTSCVVSFLAGFTVLVRPELGLAVGPLLILVFVSRSGWLRKLTVTVVALIVPLAYEIFRMGYYGLPVPNTAIAKDATGNKWGQGLLYVQDFLGVCWLWVPLLVLVVVISLWGWASIWLSPRSPHSSKSGHSSKPGWKIKFSSAPVAYTWVKSLLVFELGAGFQWLYWIHQGGDFMHGRVLLVPLFHLLLPVMSFPVVWTSRARVALNYPILSRASIMGVVAVLIWSVIAVIDGGTKDTTLIGASGIVNERQFYAINTAREHPVSIDDYLEYPRMRQLREDIAQHPQGGLYLVAANYDRWNYVPYAHGKGPTTVYFLNLGMPGMLLPLNVRVIDQMGLAFPIAAHTERLTDGRIGHDKNLFPDWAVAYTGVAWHKPQLPGFMDSGWVAQAWTVLHHCRQTQDLITSYAAPLTWARFKQNIKHSFDFMRYRLYRVPKYDDLVCHLPVPLDNTK